MGDNPSFVLDELQAQSNGQRRASSDVVESVLHDPSFSLPVSPASPKKECLDPCGKRAEVVSVKSLESGHVVIQISQSDPPLSIGSAPINQGESTVGPSTISGGQSDPPLSIGSGPINQGESTVGPSTASGGQSDPPLNLGSGPVNQGESTVGPSTASGGTKGSPGSTNLSASASTNTGTGKVPSLGTQPSMKRRMIKQIKSRRRESIISQATNDGKHAFGKEQSDFSAANTIDEAVPPWYVAMSEFYKPGRRASVMSVAAQSGRRASVMSVAAQPGRRASVMSVAAQSVDESYEVEDEDEEWDEDSGEDGDEQYYEDDEESESGNMLYTIDDNPPWYLSMGLGFQHYLTMVGSTITMPFILTPELCIQQDDPARGFILSTIFFVSGIVTFLQVTFGVRLPIVQGGSFAFFAPTLVILHTGFPACSSLAVSDLTTFQRQEEWQSRMREIQGAIIAAALIEMLIGFSGLMGLVVSLITPLAIAPTVCLVGLALFDVAAKKAASHWGISVLTILLMILFSQYMRNVKVPVPVYKGEEGFSIVAANIFGLFPVLLSILLPWALCGILTATDSLPEGSAARTDTAGRLIADSPWIRVPYPGQWGWPTVSAASVLGILAALLASIVESVGDYYACARLAGAPPPPRHAINRGIGFEGIGCLIAGFWGTGNGTTSYSENIGAIGITKVGSRRVIQYGAGIMVVCGVLGKFAAVFVTIPEPVVGGIFCVMFAMITAVGLSSLQHVDLKSSRNLFVLGFPIFFGLALPKWLENNPGIIQSVRYPVMAQVVTVLLKTSMFVGGLLGIILDNTVPGTDRERGMSHSQTVDSEDPSGVYDFPVGMTFIKRFNWLSKVPFCPTYRGWHFKKKE